MSESIDREEAERRLKEYKPSNTAATMWIDIIFPPFEPKEGEVIAVGGETNIWTHRIFVEMKGSQYMCLSDGCTDRTMAWQSARPLTDTEKGL